MYQMKPEEHFHGWYEIYIPLLLFLCRPQNSTFLQQKIMYGPNSSKHSCYNFVNNFVFTYHAD